MDALVYLVYGAEGETSGTGGTSEGSKFEVFGLSNLDRHTLAHA